MARKQSQSRQARWERAVQDAREAWEAVDNARADLQSALEGLADIKQEYQDWYDNMTDGLRETPTGQKLQEVTDLDVEWDGSDLDAAAEIIDSAEGMDLPLGWGRD